MQNNRPWARSAVVRTGGFGALGVAVALASFPLQAQFGPVVLPDPPTAGGTSPGAPGEAPPGGPTSPGPALEWQRGHYRGPTKRDASGEPVPHTATGDAEGRWWKTASDSGTQVEYIGGWRNGERHGNGRFFYADGYVWTGAWSSGAAAGMGSVLSPRQRDLRTVVAANVPFRDAERWEAPATPPVAAPLEASNGPATPPVAPLQAPSEDPATPPAVPPETPPEVGAGQGAQPPAAPPVASGDGQADAAAQAARDEAARLQAEQQAERERAEQEARARLQAEREQAERDRKVAEDRQRVASGKARVVVVPADSGAPFAPVVEWIDAPAEGVQVTWDTPTEALADGRLRLPGAKWGGTQGCTLACGESQRRIDIPLQPEGAAVLGDSGRVVALLGLSGLRVEKARESVQRWKAAELLVPELLAVAEDVLKVDGRIEGVPPEAPGWPRLRWAVEPPGGATVAITLPTGDAVENPPFAERMCELRNVPWGSKVTVRIANAQGIWTEQVVQLAAGGNLPVLRGKTAEQALREVDAWTPYLTPATVAAAKASCGASSKVAVLPADARGGWPVLRMEASPGEALWLVLGEVPERKLQPPNDTLVGVRWGSAASVRIENVAGVMQDFPLELAITDPLVLLPQGGAVADWLALSERARSLRSVLSDPLWRRVEQALRARAEGALSEALDDPEHSLRKLLADGATGADPLFSGLVPVLDRVLQLQRLDVSRRGSGGRSLMVKQPDGTYTSTPAGRAFRDTVPDVEGTLLRAAQGAATAIIPFPALRPRLQQAVAGKLRERAEVIGASEGELPASRTAAERRLRDLCRELRKAGLYDGADLPE